MTYNPADPSTIQYNSGVQGYERMLANRIPSIFDTLSSGGAAINPHKRGLEMAPGTTTGDSATLETYSEKATERAEIHRAVFHIDAWTTTPTTDIFRFGTLPSSPGATTGNVAYFDMQAGEYNVEGTTKTANVPDQYSDTILVLEKNKKTGETTFYQYQNGGLTEAVTFANTTRGRDGRAYTESNGAGESAHILYMREQFIYQPNTEA